MRAAFAKALATERFDACLSVATFFARYHAALPPHVLRLVDTHNIDSLLMDRYAATDRSLARRVYARLTARKLRALEASVFATSDLVWVCSDEEVPIVRERALGARVRVAPNGVVTSRFAPLPGATAVPDRLLFFGRLDYYPNVDGLAHFVDDVLPLVQQQRPGVELVVVGSGDRAQADAIAARNPAVRVLGRVPEVLPELAAASVVVVPLRAGGGTRLKIVEALSAGRPVVSTSVGAEGIQVTSGDELLLADTPAAFADGVVALLADPARAERLGAAGRRLMIERYDWDSIGDGILRDLADAAARRHGGSVHPTRDLATVAGASA